MLANMLASAHPHLQATQQMVIDSYKEPIDMIHK